MAFEGLDARLAGILLGLAVVDPLAVTAIGHAGLGAAVPDVAAGRPGDAVEGALGRIDAHLLERTAAIGERPGALDEIGAVRPHRPLVTVRRYLAVAVEVIEQDELPR